MVRYLFVILTLGFLVQSTGATVFFKKIVAQAAESSDETQKGVEKGKEEAKTDQENSTIIFFGDNFLQTSFSGFLRPTRLYPSGFYNIPFLPPR